MSAFKNIWNFQRAAKEQMSAPSFDYLESAADDHRTFKRNIDYWKEYQIRPRRLVDVSTIDTSLTIFGEQLKSPVILSPVGMQKLFHPEGEIASAKAAQSKGHAFIASTVSSCSFVDISNAVDKAPWFQLYTTANRATTLRLVQTAENQGSKILVLTVDVPVPGNRESNLDTLMSNMRATNALGNFPDGGAAFDPTLTWNFIEWFRRHSRMKIILKGIMTAEDAELALKYKVDGVIVSNHGGRQLESDLSTAECLPEIVKTIGGKIPVLVDGGIRRGTDIFKALALGANGVCIGRPYIYGLGADGQAGVEAVLDMLQAELVRNMQIAGVVRLDAIHSNAIQKK